MIVVCLSPGNLQMLFNSIMFKFKVNAGVEQIENAERLEWIQKRINFEDDDQRIVFNSVTNIMGPRLLLHHGFLRKVNIDKKKEDLCSEIIFEIFHKL